MQAQAAKFPGYAGKFRCFLEKEFKKVYVDSFTLEQALKQRAASV
jgi:hypothetical protein